MPVIQARATPLETCGKIDGRMSWKGEHGNRRHDLDGVSHSSHAFHGKSDTQEETAVILFRGLCGYCFND